MAQPQSTASGDIKANKPRTSSRVSSALKSGVVYGGSAVLTAVNNITPHIAGAVDILVVEQPDGSRKATPFYVRFGKYTALRTRERNVKLYVNDELAPFGMHIGMYGQAYFATETVEVRGGEVDEEQEALLAGMMSPPSGYSSGADEPSGPGGDGGEAGATLSAIRQHIDGMKEGSRASGRAGASGSGGGSRSRRVPLPALGAEPGVKEGAAAAQASATAVEERPASTHGSKLQLAPALSLADRNESFLSARETLATPMGDDLVNGAFLGAVSPAMPASPQRHSRRSSETQMAQGLAQAQAQQGGRAGAGASPGLGAPRGGSSNSLATVSEGASPCGWSEGEEGGDEEDYEVEVEAGTEGASPTDAASAGADEQGAATESPGAATPVDAVADSDTTGSGAVGAAGLRPLQQPFTCRLGSQSSSSSVLTELHHPLGLQQPLHQQLGFPENAPAVAAAAELNPGCAVLSEAGPQTSRLRLRPTVDWAQILGPSAGAGPVGHSVAGAGPLAEERDTAFDAVAGAPRLGPSSGFHRPSPGAGPGTLAASLGQEGQGPGSGPGSHSTVSLLSSSLRGGGGGAAGAPGSGRPSLGWLRAKGHATAAAAEETSPVPSTFLQLSGAGAGGEGGLQLPRSGTVGPIAAAAAVATASAAAVSGPWPPMAAAAPLPRKSPVERGLSLTLSVTCEGEVRALLTAPSLPLPPPPSAMAVATAAGPEPPPQAAVGGHVDGRSAAATAELPSGSDSGYLGDAERGAAVSMAAAAALVRIHPHGSHPHRQHHHQCGHGHGRARHNHSGHLHSTSAPLPSSAIGAAAVAAAAADVAAAATSGGGASGAVMTTTATHGIELSLCGGHLAPTMSYAEADALFDANRVSEHIFFSRAHQLAGGAELAIRLSNGVIFPCQPLSYSLLGLLAFGSWRLLPGTPCWAPEGADAAGASEAAATSAAAAAAAMLAAAGTPKNGATGAVMASSSAATTPKKGQTGSSWRAWMFGSRREGAAVAVTRTSATGGGGGGVTGLLTGRSPPLTSPIAERQSSIELRPGGGAEAPPPPQQSDSSAAAPAEGMGGGAADAMAAVPGVAAVPSRSGSGGSQRPHQQVYNVITKKSLTPTAEQLAALPLKYGQNTITYKVGASELRAYVYFQPWRTRIVISDIDGTITRSDVLGHLLPAMGLDWSHPGIAQLLTNIRQNDYLIMYLSSRSISQANITRDFINTLVQGEHRMPLGPVIISPHGLLPSLYREMILRRPHEFKIATLQDIRALFPTDWNPFYGGFGNRDTDEISYREVGVKPSRIFIINPRGELRQPADSKPLADSSPTSPAAPAGAAARDAKLQSQDDAAAATAGSEEQPAAVTAPLSPTSAAAASASRAVGAVALAPPVTSRRVTVASGAVATVAAAAAAVALSTLSAINELVHDIFPPLRDGEPIITSSEDEKAASCSDEATGAAGAGATSEAGPSDQSEGGGARGDGAETETGTGVGQVRQRRSERAVAAAAAAGAADERCYGSSWGSNGSSSGGEGRGPGRGSSEEAGTIRRGPEAAAASRDDGSFPSNSAGSTSGGVTSAVAEPDGASLLIAADDASPAAAPPTPQVLSLPTSGAQAGRGCVAPEESAAAAAASCATSAPADARLLPRAEAAAEVRAQQSASCGPTGCECQRYEGGSVAGGSDGGASVPNAVEEVVATAAAVPLPA